MTNETHSSHWMHVPVSLIIDYIGYPALHKEMIPSFCRHNMQLLSEAIQTIIANDAKENNLAVVPITSTQHRYKPEIESLQCLVYLDGDSRDIEQVIDLMQSSVTETRSYEEIEPYVYNSLKRTALKVMRENNIKDFSAEELHRVFNGTQEETLYMSIIRQNIKEGLTIERLYEMDRNLGR